MEVASTTETIMANSSSDISGESSITSSVQTRTAAAVEAPAAESSVNLLTFQNQNGQFIIQQPLKTVINGPTLVNNGATVSKGHIIVRQKATTANQQTAITAGTSVLGDMTVLERAGVKRPLTSSGSNVITKVIITKNPSSGQPQALPSGTASQTFTVTSVPSSNLSKVGVGSQQQVASSTPTKTVTLTSQGILSPVKTVIATIPGAGTPKISVPYHKIPISPVKTPTKITMIPMSRSPNKSSLSSNITVLSRALNTLAHTSGVPLKPGSPSKVIIKQGPAVSIITYLCILYT